MGMPSPYPFSFCQLEWGLHRMERAWIPESLFFLIEESHPPTRNTHSGVLYEQEIRLHSTRPLELRDV